MPEITNEHSEAIMDSILEEAKRLWACCPDDFCIQHISYDSIVFGGVNRVVWHVIYGFRIDESYCTNKFKDHYKKVFDECDIVVKNGLIKDTKVLQEFKDNMANQLYGMTTKEAIEKGICIQCRKKAIPRCYSEAGKKEYHISGLCEKCFDEIVGG